MDIKRIGCLEKNLVQLFNFSFSINTLTPHIFNKAAVSSFGFYDEYLCYSLQSTVYPNPRFLHFVLK